MLAEPEEVMNIDGDKEELLDVMSEISELATRMQHATSQHRMYQMLMQQQVFIDQLVGYLQRLPNDVELTPIPDAGAESVGECDM